MSSQNPRPAPRIKHRTFDLQQIVNQVERQATGSSGPKNVPVYSFGSGRNRRVFTEKV